MSGRSLAEERKTITEATRERSEASSLDDLRELRSAAATERILHEEHHGRFLIELIQNAADAMAKRPGRVRIEIHDGPALLIANEGDPFEAETVANSLGYVGASTKPEGDAIGHKGIGFKSVLTMSPTPEIYSMTGLAATFDSSRVASALSASPVWPDRGEVLASGEGDLDLVPILRFPFWIEEVPRNVQALLDEGFSTVIRLPFREGTKSGEGCWTPESWLTEARTRIDAFTDETLLLIDSIAAVEVKDRLLSNDWAIHRRSDNERQVGETRVHASDVSIQRTDTSSDWILFRSATDDTRGLSSELKIGVPVVASETGGRAVAASDLLPFHLFFPTTISSGFPLLLHAYFKVNASRTGFFAGAHRRNEALLDELANLVGLCIPHLVADEALDTTELVNALRPDSPPEGALARQFSERAVGALDGQRWVPVMPVQGEPSFAAPEQLLVLEEPTLHRRLAAAFPPQYVHEKVRLRLPAEGIDDGGLDLLSRRPGVEIDPLTAAERLLRTGATRVWPEGAEDGGFRHLLEMLNSLRTEGTDELDELIDRLRGEPGQPCRIVPVVSEDGGRLLLPIPPEQGGTRILTRVGAKGGHGLVPPQSLRVAFVDDALLDSASLATAQSLQMVAAFSVDSVVDRLTDDVTRNTSEPEALLLFLWRFLSAEPGSEFSVRQQVERIAHFAPGESRWTAGAVRVRSDSDRARERRLRRLARVRLPNREGVFRPAEELCLGGDWAQWLEELEALSEADRTRARSYKALELIAPSESWFVASPQQLQSMLPVQDWAADAHGDEDPEDGQYEAPTAERALLGFLLGLGVWEVPPLELFRSRDQRGSIEQRFPWGQEVCGEPRLTEAHRQFGQSSGWNGGPHENVHIADDVRFRWSLGECADRDRAATAEALDLGASLYEETRYATVFCPTCKSGASHFTRWYWSSDENPIPSTAALELQRESWLPVKIAGEPSAEPRKSIDAWWEPPASLPSQWRNSPLQFLALVDLGAKGDRPSLLSIANVVGLEAASANRVLALLDELEDRFRSRTLEPDPSQSASASQAFAGLHRRCYERLHDLQTGQRPDRVLCRRRGSLDYVDADIARHDDGGFVSLKHYFEGDVWFLELPQERSAVARSIGVEPFVVHLGREPGEEAEELTESMRVWFEPMVPTLMAVLAHHSLGAQTLEVGSSVFNDRARRLQRLRFLHVADLVVSAKLEGGESEYTLGRDSHRELLVEGGSRLYFDAAERAAIVDGELPAWFARRLGRELAILADNAAYSSLFGQLLEAEIDERVGMLSEVGIGSSQIEDVARLLDLGSDEHKRQAELWRGALVAAAQKGGRAEPLSRVNALTSLRVTGMAPEVAEAVVDTGEGDDPRSDWRPEGALEVVEQAGLDLAVLDETLRAAGDPGLRVGASAARLKEWRTQYEPLLLGVMQLRGITGAEGRAIEASWVSPAETVELDPAPAVWLSPAVDALGRMSVEVEAGALAVAPAAAIASALGESQSTIESAARAAESSDTALRLRQSAAGAWRERVVRLAACANGAGSMQPDEIRRLVAQLEALLPADVGSPAQIADHLVAVFEDAPELRDALSTALSDPARQLAGPSEAQIDDLIDAHGLDAHGMDRIEDALRSAGPPLRQNALSRRLAILGRTDFTLGPATLKTMQPAPTPDPKQGRKIGTRKVRESFGRDAKRRGDEGEGWVLALMLKQLLELPPAGRFQPISDARDLVRRVGTGEGPDTIAKRGTALLNRIGDVDLQAELPAFLHVSKLSDEFGFDLLGWLPAEDGTLRACCLEVKSSTATSFHFSLNERATSQRLGEEYAVVVVQRGPSEAPDRIDVLPDPAALVSEGRILLGEDGFVASYER